MAIRNTTHVLKNSDIVNRPLPSSLLKGEPIVNTADGIVFFSGFTTSSSEWTPAGTGTTANFFEVGSNLYDLRLRNQITEYQGQNGINLVGKFLLGTISGFTLADFAENDVYVTGSTLTSATNNTNSQSSQLLYHGTPIGGPYSINTENTFTTGGTYNSGTTALDFTRNDGVTFSVNLSGIDINDTYVTGGTNNAATNNTNAASISLLYNQDVVPGTYSLPYTDVFTTGGTYNNGTKLITFDRNDSTTYDVDLSTLDINNTFVTGFTYNPSTNTFTISQNEGESPLTAQINTVSGLTVSNLTSGRVVYVGTGGLLTDEAEFTYDTTTNTLNVENIDASGDVTIQGSLTVFGPSISAFTSNLYVEDPNITLNYNPTGSTTVTSVNAGITVQDGNGVSSGDVNLDIIRMQNLTGLTATEIPDVSEYTGLTGYANRGWITQLNDIVIRSTDVTDGGVAGDINGVRVLAEFDVLDGGTY